MNVIFRRQEYENMKGRKIQSTVYVMMATSEVRTLQLCGRWILSVCRGVRDCHPTRSSDTTHGSGRMSGSPPSSLPPTPNGPSGPLPAWRSARRQWIIPCAGQQLRCDRSRGTVTKCVSSSQANWIEGAAYSLLLLLDGGVLSAEVFLWGFSLSITELWQDALLSEPSQQSWWDWSWVLPHALWAALLQPRLGCMEGVLRQKYKKESKTCKGRPGEASWRDTNSASVHLFWVTLTLSLFYELETHSTSALWLFRCV